MAILLNEWILPVHEAANGRVRDQGGYPVKFVYQLCNLKLVLDLELRSIKFLFCSLILLGMEAFKIFWKKGQWLSTH